jgi:glycosyltransferase involved in cell wall biosynthesis
VSVIVPVHDGAAYLGAALASAAAQDPPPLEIVVVDDGSTDDSAAIAERQPLVRCLRQPHRGCAAARNAGVEAAHGALLAFLDADDAWTPGGLRARVAFLAAHPELDGVVAHQELYLEPGTERSTAIRPEHLDAPQPGWLPSALVIRRQAFARVGPFDVSYRLSSDVDWFLRAKDLGVRIELLPEVVVRRRIHHQNLSATHEQGHPALLRAVRASIAR